MQYAACAQIPGLDAPVALALPEQRVDLGGSCASSTAATSCRVDGANPVEHCPGIRDTWATRLARYPEGCQAIHTMSALGPKASSARGVPLAKRATVTEACSPSPVRSFLRAALPGWTGRAHGFLRSIGIGAERETSSRDTAAEAAGASSAKLSLRIAPPRLLLAEPPDSRIAHEELSRPTDWPARRQARGLWLPVARSRRSGRLSSGHFHRLSTGP